VRFFNSTMRPTTVLWIWASELLTLPTRSNSRRARATASSFARIVWVTDRICAFKLATCASFALI
jgi:hypothetical protein